MAITTVTPTDKINGEPTEPQTTKPEDIKPDQEMLKVIEQIHNDVKMTKKDIRAKLNSVINAKEEKLFKKENEEKLSRNKKMQILDKLSNDIGEDSK